MTLEQRVAANKRLITQIETEAAELTRLMRGRHRRDGEAGA